MLQILSIAIHKVSSLSALYPFLLFFVGFEGLGFFTGLIYENSTALLRLVKGSKAILGRQRRIP